MYTPPSFAAAIELLGLVPTPNPGEQVKRIEMWEEGWVVWYESPESIAGQPVTRRERRGYSD